jgi:hypothetical protein
MFRFLRKPRFVSSIDIKHNLAILYGSITFIGLFEGKRIQDISSRHANEVYTLKELQKVEEKEENNWWKEKDLQRNKPKPLYILNKDDPVVYLKNNTNQAEVYLIGSNHVSPESLKLIRNVIRKLRPLANYYPHMHLPIATPPAFVSHCSPGDGDSGECAPLLEDVPALLRGYLQDQVGFVMMERVLEGINTHS